MSKTPPSKKRKLNTDSEEHLKFFKNCNFHIIEAGIGKARCDIFRNQITKYGGSLSDLNHCTHLIVNDDMVFNRLIKILKTDVPSGVPVLKTKWLSCCFREKKIVECTDHQLKPITSIKEEKFTKLKEESVKVPNTQEVSAEKLDCELKEGGDHLSSQSLNAPTISGQVKTASPKVDKWVCAKSSLTGDVNHNQHITEKLKELANIYDKSNDRWRALGYQKAISILKKHPKQITSWEEAIKLPGVGKRLADKIWEIIQSGHLYKLEELNASSETQTLKLFTDVWGAGPATAQQWIHQGFQTLDDLRTKADLTHNQKVGLKHYEEFLERMPRAEAAEIEKMVVDAAKSVQPGIMGMACGSYRRGKQTCGDVDVLITHPDGKSHHGVFGKLLKKLHNDGFLTDDLVTQKDNGNQAKYLGVCKLPGEETKHRRLDIIVVPYSEFACAQMYFTGSAHFNRSMRNLCKQSGMSLSEHSLNKGVIRKDGEKINPGERLPTPTEASIFEHLGLTYRTPAERDH